MCTVFLLLISQANAHAKLFETVTACEMSTLRAFASTAHGVLWELGCSVEKKASATETMQEQTTALGGCTVDKSVTPNTLSEFEKETRALSEQWRYWKNTQDANYYDAPNLAEQQSAWKDTWARRTKTKAFISNMLQAQKVCPVLDSHKRALAVLCAVHAAALDAKDVRYNAILYGVNARIQTNCCDAKSVFVC